ncbi:monovalent cation/H+ antiporter complex subunit F [Halobacillus sp. Marseille-Q1614]|uniref:monovalent cation/H+ antiporter complex subunit F n=1 Tax=Halobacillus sp. Marseille-Q1614 TaxID=2709134 RepID=UPI00156EFE37|nr:monovalent cation/H+ antiporter complex subunit F [Halobacillus sp. Marseille-Q1614]
MEQTLEVTRAFVNIAAVISIIGVSISVLLLLYRVLFGPSNPDRILAVDGLGVNVMGLAGILAILLVTNQLNDVILLIGILLFIGTIALAKFIEKGVIIDRDMD